MRVVIDSSLSMLIGLYSEIMQQVETSKIEINKQIHISTVTLEGKSALQFTNASKERFAWAVWSDEVPCFIVWFADETKVRELEQGCAVPDIMVSHAITYSFARNVITSINDFIVNDVLPKGIMPRGHMPSITKFN